MFTNIIIDGLNFHISSGLRISAALLFNLPTSFLESRDAHTDFMSRNVLTPMIFPFVYGKHIIKQIAKCLIIFAMYPFIVLYLLICEQFGLFPGLFVKSDTEYQDYLCSHFGFKFSLFTFNLFGIITLYIANSEDETLCFYSLNGLLTLDQ